MTGDLYIQSVIDQIPSGLPLRDQIAMELRVHIAERMGNGQPLDDILRQLGDPTKLAESYLAAIPLKNAPLGKRVLAKIIDFVLVGGVFGIAVVVSVLIVRMQGPEIPEPYVYYVWFLPVAAIALSVFGFVGYTIQQEYRRGATIGKRMMGIRVVQESGANITLGQAVLRQLPLFFQIFIVDVLFALFTEKRQRAFELITKTRAVAVAFAILAVG